MAERLHRFRGGLELPGMKEAATASPIRVMPPPKRIVLPLSQHIGEPAKPRVAPGERVLRGQMVAAAEGIISAAIHASTSGTVVAIEDHLVPHPSGLAAPCIIIDADGRDEAIEPVPLADWENRDAGEIRERVRDAGIVGLGGAAFPSWIKLSGNRDQPLDTLILNGAECEPCISCDDMLMRERADEVISGTRIMLRALHARHCLVAVEDNKPEAAEALQAALAKFADPRIELVIVPSRYPQGGERQLIETLTGREVPHDGLPLDIGIVCHNVATAAAVHRAVVHGEPLTSRIVTVTGGGVAEPCNVEARIGTRMSELIAFCGGYRGDVARLIMGGPMMGFTLRSDDAPVIKASNCLLAGTAEEFAPRRETLPCIRCGACADACPASLLPQMLYWHTRARDFERVQEYDLFDCIECGSCDLVCPSQIPLVSHFRYAKTEIWGKNEERAKADNARRRHEARQARLEREAREQEEKRRRKLEALEKMKSGDAKKAEIAAALERAQKRKEERS